MSELTRVSREDRDGSVLVRVRGEIDLSNAQELANMLERAVTDEAPVLVADFSDLTYLDSAGVHLLFELAERLSEKGKRLRIVVPEDAAIRRVLVVAAVDQALPIDSCIEDALAAISGAVA